VRAVAFAAHSLPIARFPAPEQLYSVTGLAPRPGSRPASPAGAASAAKACPSTATPS
jgi:hypothetical protein